MSDEGIILPPGGTVHELPKNELSVDVTDSSETGAAAHLGLEREHERKNGTLSIGVEAGISQKKGWGVGAFFKRVWK